MLVSADKIASAFEIGLARIRLRKHFGISCLHGVAGISDSKVIICMGNSGSNTEQAPFR
jgi:hypothetical protein